MRKFKYAVMALVAFATLAFLPSCEIDEINDPNNPSLGSVSEDASKAELQVLVTGLEARNRVAFENATEMWGTFAREVWAFFGSDPRFIDDWLGVNITETYPDFFASAGTYVSPYLAIKQANVLIDAANESSVLTQEEANGYSGFAKTIKAYQLLFPLLQQWDNGIRVDVNEPLNPGPVLGYDEALQEIRNILDEGFSELQNAETPFDLTAGWNGFSDAEGIAKVNRAIAARAALYAEDYRAALDHLNNSFMDLSVTTIPGLYIGPELIYGEAPDINNPLFYPLDRPTNTILVVHPAMLEDALDNDKRVDLKFAERVNNPLSSATSEGTQLTANYQDGRWESNTSPIEFIRNEELILIYAEAKARLGEIDDAIDAINTIRNIWCVGDYNGNDDLESVIDEILFQRRYSLWAEGGHRWVDLRRTGRLNENFVDLRDGGAIFNQVARRVSEIAWDQE